MKRHNLLNRMLAVVFFASVDFAFAHSGGLDTNGGHTERATGKYHCHKSYCAQREVAGSSALETTNEDDDRADWTDADYE